MKKSLPLLALWLCLASAVGAQSHTCPAGYVPRPFQDCIGAINICGPDFIFRDSLCGRGIVDDSVVGTCGTSERISSWYTFTVTRPGRLSFVIQPSDTTPGVPCRDFTGACGSNQDYDYVIYRIPDSVRGQDAACQAINGRGNSNQVSCNYSGREGATGIFDLNGAFGNPTGQVSAGSFDTSNIQVQVGERFILLVNNFRSTTVGYKIHFYTPADDPARGYADVTEGSSIGIDEIYYDPSCVGACPVLVTLTRLVNVAGMRAQLYDPRNLNAGQQLAVSALGGNYTSSLWLTGNFNPTDTNLVLVLANDSLGAFECYDNSSGTFGPVRQDSVMLKPRRYKSTLTSARGTKTETLSVTPNPFTSHLMIDRSGLPGQAVLRIRNVTGAEAMAPITLPSGAKVEVDLPATLPPGIYTLEVSSAGRVLRQRLVRGS